MTWVRIDDHFDEHPKLAQAGTICWGVWLAGIAYCNRNLTDGFIPWSVAHGLGSWSMLDLESDEDSGRTKVYTIGRMCGMSGDDLETEWVIERLVGVGLWDQVPGGFRIHDYSDYQPSKADVLKERSRNKERQADWRKRNAGSNDATNAGTNEPVMMAPYPVPVPVPVPITDLLASVVGNGMADDSWIDHERLYLQRTRRKRISPGERTWLEDLYLRHSRDKLVAALKAVPNPRQSGYLQRLADFMDGTAPKAGAA